MLTNKTVKLFGLLVNLAFYSGNSPFVWCSKRRRISIITGKLKWGWVLQSQFLMQLYLLYLVGTIGRELAFKEEPKLSEIPLAFGTMLIMICVMIITYNFFWRAEDLKYLINSFQYFCCHLEERFGPFRIKNRKIITHLPDVMLICCVGIFGFATLFGLYFIMNPQDKMYWTSSITDPWIRKAAHVALFPSCVTFAVGGGAILLVALFTLTLPMLVAYELGKEVSPSIKDTKDSNGKSTPSDEEYGLTRPPTIILFYRTITIHVTLINNMISPILYLFQSFLSFCIVACNFCLIRFHDILSLNAFLIVAVLSYLAVSGWVGVLWFAGIGLKISSNKIDMLRRHGTFPKFGSISEKKWFKKVLKSFRPIHVKAGSFYPVKMMRTLMFIHFLIWATTKALLFSKKIN